MWNLHIDRALSVYLCHPLARRRGGRRLRIPILMYHSIREGKEGRSSYYQTNTSPQVFAQQMKLLREGGFRVLSADKAAETLPSGIKPSQSEAAVITFDDGYADFYRNAFPILTEHNFTATVFVITGLLKTQRACFKGTECLTLSEVRELHSQGISIGSHTVTHPELRLLPQDKLENELSGSKKALEDALGAPVKSFSYPFAFPEADRGFVRRLADLLNKCGYENGVTTILGTAHRGSNRWFLPRLPISSGDDPRSFRAKLEGGYDWLHGPQYLYKSIKGRMKLKQNKPEAE
jgi:peptidoglycan/xylan/chitin deacetylase (PgdA/CDA1 family)